MENLTEINCKEIFRKAYENRYTWKNEFNGYKGKCIFLIYWIILQKNLPLEERFFHRINLKKF